MSGWCAGCGGRHEAGACPGELEITEPERHAWRVNIDTPRGIEAIGVLLAPAGRWWRARIVTYPRQLWVVPGGGQTIKLAGRSAQDAEAAAVAYIREHCEEKGFTIRGETARPRLAAEVAATPATPREAPHDAAAPRRPCFLPVMFGVTRPTETAGTGDLSETGMFVMTESPLSADQEIRLLLQLDAERLTMRGRVRWSRTDLQIGRAPGMGVELIDPPGEYLRYVRAIG